MRIRSGMPLVSVVTVVRNGERHLEEAIRSVIGQENANVEYIVVDGGSTDGTLDIIRRYEDRIDRWVSEPDQGIYDAMNKGISLATGDLIGLLNSDDRYEPGALEEVSRAYRDQGGGDAVIAGKWRLLFEDPDLVITASPSLRFHTGMPISHQAMFVPKPVYDVFGVYDRKYRYAADLDMLVRLHLGGVRFRFLDRILVGFRTFGASDRHYRESVREAAGIIRDNFPRSTFLLYRVISWKYLALAAASKKLRSLFGAGAVSRLERLYFRWKTLYSRQWD